MPGRPEQPMRARSLDFRPAEAPHGSINGGRNRNRAGPDFGTTSRIFA
jgi:hypothetical protein